MKYRSTIFILSIVNLLNIGYAQTLNQKLDSIILKYYPNANDPGIVLLIQSKPHQLNYSFQRGVSSLENKNKLTTQTNFRMASVSKQFTAMAIYKLIESGKLQLNTPIKNFFPQLQPSVGKITIHQLLNHSSGIIDYENRIPDSRKTQLMDQDVLDYISAVDSLYFKPGNKFRYSNTGYCLLALIVEIAGGSDYSSFVKEHIFSPLKMENSLVYWPKANIDNRAFGYHPEANRFIFADQSLTSATKGDGGVYTSAEEYLKWATSMVKIAKDQQAILDTDYMKSNLFPILPGVAYSMGWFLLQDLENRTYLTHSGESTGFHNIVLQQPEQGIYISLFSNRDDLVIAECYESILKELGIYLGLNEGATLFNTLSNIYANKY